MLFHYNETNNDTVRNKVCTIMCVTISVLGLFWQNDNEQTVRNTFGYVNRPYLRVNAVLVHNDHGKIGVIPDSDHL